MAQVHWEVNLGGDCPSRSWADPCWIGNGVWNLSAVTVIQPGDQHLHGGSHRASLIWMQRCLKGSHYSCVFYHLIILTVPVAEFIVSGWDPSDADLCLIPSFPFWFWKEMATKLLGMGKSWKGLEKLHTCIISVWCFLFLVKYCTCKHFSVDSKAK